MNDFFKFVENGSITTPQGFRACGVTAGLKASGKADMALIFSEIPANFAGAFTSCLFAAAPVQVDRKRVLDSKFVQAIIVNSGNANACTGRIGLENAEKTCQMTAQKMGLTPDAVMVSSTGRIGVQLNMAKIAKGIELAAAALSNDGGSDAARAIMTTDTVPKTAAVTFTIDGKPVSIGAMTKGAGMISPKMVLPHATMLCYITTDARIENSLLAKMLGIGVDLSFNRITIDNDMSTNDSCIIMANGKSGITIQQNSTNAELFQQALSALLKKLAVAMVKDGEGATKLVNIEIHGAASRVDAEKAAKAVANSMLCKTAWFGGDPNWGRVAAALGYSGAIFEPEKVDVYYNSKPVIKKGQDAGTPEKELAAEMAGREFTIKCNLNAGSVDYNVWTSDLSYEYVKINAEYTT
ncbi:MAG: bifunctional glutamate N-acetyltransferase/amino-acid acetyltransferase ArgJ [Lentisphaerae bacterium]|jgi:glutamate N-acetyltransferase/amino-acid N-acetyltransferase|nr:bifunctional glutamate N-acetyltransferase/amino-acid acetyltransferase ArgJ [Victivallaceae bacterium]MDD3704439.1 bifunctional glutamate N-acetyltransferase/amino-acid acetyltransferase ArgJ [Victivallaceae bacterium]MDD5664418.1 bifunctional glutamate N-acetyltransferase/amino-acid acetyltransferase ArgJ [Victivallaceae bacterium]NLK84271.1 bifunctional glutamate N-acetyltransferase/amino-acid acetyltransferase ArgJ [Lentisphaerota bacterium]